MGFTNNWTNRAIRTIFYDSVRLIPGSVLYTKLIGIPFSPLGTPEHTGIYIGDGLIAEVHGSGVIHVVTLDEFIDIGSHIRVGLQAFVLTDSKGNVLASEEIADRAIAKLGSDFDYSLFFNNCHTFTSYCITGKENTTDITFTQVLFNMKERFGVKHVDWRVCEGNE